MDPVKVVIFIAAFLLLLLLGRKLSSSSESAGMVPLPEQLPSQTILDEDRHSSNKKLTVVGADLPFPVHIPEIACDRDGKYNRPEFLNYYFEETDLLRGPQDPSSFYDNFYLEVRDIENAHTALYRYFVATPLGLQKALASEPVPVICLEEQSLIVARWDVPLILEEVVSQVMKAYAEARNKEAHALPNPDVSENDLP
jgi:hypothetical protein